MLQNAKNVHKQTKMFKKIHKPLNNYQKETKENQKLCKTIQKRKDK